jgi:hypothetical protein
VVYIESTTQSNFLLYFSYPRVIEELPLQDNLVVTINGQGINYQLEQSQPATYVVTTELSDMAVC